MLILIFSVMLYNYIRITIFENSVHGLLVRAENITKLPKIPVEKIPEYLPDPKGEFITSFVYGEKITKPKFYESQEGESNFLTLQYPYSNEEILQIKTDVTVYANIANQILVDIIILNLTMIFLIIFYAMFLSRTLLMPIKVISQKLASLDEKFLAPLDMERCESEFRPILTNINRLIDRIQTFIMYQKELFIGIAHELKTPLAVMKTKNEVTLIKPREAEKYIEALQNNNKSIDDMNKMIISILEIGRQEGAQFESPEQLDIVQYLGELCVNFKILAKNEKKDVVSKISPKSLEVSIQKNLFMHIIQNFVQNAIKFSPEGEVIEVFSEISGDYFIVRVENLGESIDESQDFFAPFKRKGGKPGAGLGLFLAKNAAQAMGASVSLKNSPAKDKIVATLTIPLKNLKK
ncbi:HAMP domain-containing histidine kinase [Campylobacter sp. JMF_02 ED1]|uniref:sensor histidine kinase n=1 Tax=unclassified Campylobacter TaxID=2593542 RepID=UPI0022E9B479|nr:MULTISPECIES: HAMP domain-containing sensor histidine kinase [unclassified Campylobacter]MDA3050057.1 HAMP domain-containing histidine kinase [Campylobacter sp. JMF_15 NE4]MDA3051797.1 HAMP domain-containing histidine kinase [Campylobacter sp. JMF_02 ED1]